MSPSKKQPSTKEPHSVGLLFLGLILFVLITTLLILTQEVGGLKDYTPPSLPFIEDREEVLPFSGNLTSVYIAQAETFFVPAGFPREIFINGYSDIKEASFYRDNSTKEELHTYKIAFGEPSEVVLDHIHRVLDDSGYNVRAMTKSYVVGEKRGSYITLTLVEAEGSVVYVQTEYRKAGSRK